MEFRLFGPGELWCGSQRIDLGHAKQRSVLAVLLMEPGRVVPVHTLVDRVWGHSPPDTALSVLYGYVTRLRKVLSVAGVRLDRRSGGYLVDVDPDCVDVHRFRRLLADGSPAALDEALTLWRGTPLAGTAGPWVARTREVLEEQWLAAQVARNAAYLAAGRHAELIGQLLDVVSAYPMDERLVVQLMLALSRSGRTADALAQYRLARRRLLERQGSEPGPLLRDTLRQILGEPVREPAA
jgi:DNA-binding SARP family transcriptional activator